MSTKDLVAQEVLAHETVYKISKLLDQLCDGMKTLPVLRLLRAFPDLFLSLFTYTGRICSADVLEAIYVHDDTHLVHTDALVLSFLKQYIQESDDNGECSFCLVVLCPGIYFPPPAQEETFLLCRVAGMKCLGMRLPKTSPLSHNKYVLHNVVCTTHLSLVSSQNCGHLCCT